MVFRGGMLLGLEQAKSLEEAMICRYHGIMAFEIPKFLEF